MSRIRLGMFPWSQSTEWRPMLEFARRIDDLGYDHLWCWDHLLAIYGDPDQPAFEGWSILSAWAIATERVRLGLLVGANTFRNPGLVAKLTTTLDHISGGRAICGLGGGWFAPEHEAFGIEFGSGHGERLDWLDESVGVIRRLLDGEEVTHTGLRYRFDRLVLRPRPVRERVPILVGGAGERKTLRTVAEHADIWNVYGTPQEVARKDAILREHCEAVGRDDRAIERTVTIQAVIRDTEDEARDVWISQTKANGMVGTEASDVWLGPPAGIVERMVAYTAAGFRTFICEMPAPYDAETAERLIAEVKPEVEADAS